MGSVRTLLSMCSNFFPMSHWSNSHTGNCVCAQNSGIDNILVDKKRGEFLAEIGGLAEKGGLSLIEATLGEHKYTQSADVLNKYKYKYKYKYNYIWVHCLVLFMMPRPPSEAIWPPCSNRQRPASPQCHSHTSAVALFFETYLFKLSPDLIKLWPEIFHYSPK